MKRPFISCIVPVYNGERYLRETLDSILAQTYRPLEIIVIDDGSDDGTEAVLADYEGRVRREWQANAGETAARNRGLALMQGDFVAFLDADDLWHPEKLARQMVRFQERPELELCYTRFQNFWVPELAEEEKDYENHPLSRPLSGYTICSLLARAQAFKKFGIFTEDGSRNPQSFIWFLRAVENGATVEMLSDVLMFRRLHLNNCSRQNSRDFIFPILKAWRDHQRKRANG